MRLSQQAIRVSLTASGSTKYLINYQAYAGAHKGLLAYANFKSQICERLTVFSQQLPREP